ncbi:MAG: hypothetical protein ACFNWW_05775 [Negativicutes bacterium]|jgi:hypothetical protein
MKKIVFSLFIAALVALSTNIGYAANWKWITSDGILGFFVDTDTIHYELYPSLGNEREKIDTSKVTYWLKIYFPPESAKKMAEVSNNPLLRNMAFMTAHETISFQDRTNIVHELILYDTNGYVIPSSKPNKKPVNPIEPGTTSETIFMFMKAYAKEHSAELALNAYGYL